LDVAEPNLDVDPAQVTTLTANTGIVVKGMGTWNFSPFGKLELKLKGNASRKIQKDHFVKKIEDG